MPLLPLTGGNSGNKGHKTTRGKGSQVLTQCACIPCCSSMQACTCVLLLLNPKHTLAQRQ
eukprot:1161782-Pelagomonas_calceolata.AAC.23